MVNFKKMVMSAIFAMATVAPVIASAELITFEDRPDNQATITNGYHGFNWSNFVSMNSNLSAASGYQNSDVSPSKVVFNANGTPATLSSATGFTLNDAFFTAAWNDGLNIHVVGTTTASQTLIKDFIVDTSGPLNMLFNWTDLLSVSFASSGGIPHAGYTGLGTHFSMDNLTVNEAVAAVPEPATLALLGLGLFGFAAARRRKQ